MYEENILSVRLDDITIITRATCGSAIFNVETRDLDIASSNSLLIHEENIKENHKRIVY